VIIFLKFSLSGVFGVAINFAGTYFLKEVLKIYKYLANSISLLIALIFNYFLNRLWTFEALSDPILSQFLKFLIVVFASILFNHVIVYLCHSKLLFKFYVAKIIAVCIVFFWNYLMHSNFTFNI